MRDRLHNSLAHFVPLIAWLMILSPLVLKGQFYLSEDLETLLVQFPLKQLLGQSLHKGQLPLWSPQISGGFPVMAEGEIGVMYPINLVLFRHLDAYLAYQLVMGLSPLLTLMAALGWLRQRGHSSHAALLGAMSFTFGGYALGHLRFLNHIEAMGVLPLTLLFAERYLDKRKLLEAIFAGAIWSLALLAGSFVTFALTGIALLVLTLARCLERPLPELVPGAFPLAAPPLARLFGQALLFLPIAAGVAFLLAAPQILLTLDILPWMDLKEERSVAALATQSLTPAHLIQFLAPHWHGIPAAGTYQLEGPYWETLGYVGILPLILCLLAPLGFLRKDRRALFSGGMVVLGLAMAFGPLSPVYRVVLMVLPQLSWMGSPGRFLLLVTAGLSSLAALGFDEIVIRSKGRPKISRLMAPMGVLFLFLTALELGWVGRPLLNWMDPAELRATLPTRALIPRLGPYRLMSIHHQLDAKRRAPAPPNAPNPLHLELRALLWPDYQLLQDLNAVSTSLGLRYRAYTALEAAILQALKPDGEGGLSVPDDAFQLINFLGVRVVLSTAPLSHALLVPLGEVEVSGLETPVYSYGIEEPAGRSYLSRGIRECRPEETLERILLGRTGSGWEPCGAEREDAPPKEDESRGVSGYQKVNGRSETSIAFTVNLLNDGYLIVRESYAPGWIAWIDDAEVPIEPVDYLYRANRVPKGMHSVRHEYRPRGMNLGLTLNFVGIMTIAIGLMVSFMSRKRSPPSWVDGQRESGHEGENSGEWYQ